MRLDSLLDPQQRDEFSDALFVSVFGRKPNHKRNRAFVIRYLSTISKTREELIEIHPKRGVAKEQLAAIYETGIAPGREDYKKYPSRLVQR